MRSMLPSLSGALVLLILSTVPSHADGPCPGPPIDFGPQFGAPAEGSVVLTNQLSSCGVTFSAPEGHQVNWFGGVSVSAYPYCINVDIGTPATPIRIDFSSPVPFVSVTGYDGGGDIDTMILEAYGPGDVLVDSQTLTNYFGFPGLTAFVTGEIAYVTVRAEAEFSGLFFDDLVFGGPLPVASVSWGAVKLMYRD